MHDDGISNPTDNRPFEDVLAARLSRRSALAGGAATAAATLLATQGVAGAVRSASVGVDGAAGHELISFTSIPLQDGPEPTIAPEYSYSVLIPWLEKLDGSGDSYALETLTSEQQANAVGIGHDGMWYFGDQKSGMLCINHEFGTNSTVLGKSSPESLEDVRISQHAHGVTVAKIRRVGSRWKMLPSFRNRRIHVNTPVDIAGPAANHHWLRNRAGSPYLGTLNNCANGYTPWGTYLTCEENFNGYFGATSDDWEPTGLQARYSFSSNGFGYGWHNHDPRFDLSNEDYANEENRFGWVVEIDPRRPNLKPTKRTAMGRVKHEGAAVTEGRGGRVVAYMGDDERFEYIYRYVSRANWQSMFNAGVHPLDRGSLFVAKFDDDGTGRWIRLSPSTPELSDWSMDEILINTRGAGDAVGATPMDRPEWTSIGPDNEVYVTLTNNSRRTEPGPGNPQAPNLSGHIIKIVDSRRNTGARFEWEFFAISTEVEDEAGQMYGSPDGIWADPDGRVFVETDGFQPGGNNDQLLVADPDANFRRLFTGVVGCEVTGVAVTPDRTTMFVNLQHPGNGNPETSNFPEPYTGAGGPVPRDATIVITRNDGGVVGS